MNVRTATIEVDKETAATLKERAAERGLTVPELVAEMTALQAGPVELSAEEIAELDRRWAAIEAGEATVPHNEVVRWLETWGTPAFKPWEKREAG
jgi:predicted transcriptional regulator